MTVRPLIEQWFPAATVGAESLRDASAAKKPPPNRLHVWWARRPLTTSRAAVVASLLPAWPTDAEAAADSHAAQVRAALEVEFPDGERAYHAWYLRTLGILGDPVAGRKAIKAANERGEKLAGNGYGYVRAFTQTPDQSTVDRIHRLAGARRGSAGPLRVLDPFAGGGAIPFEAGRFGFLTSANELNPVAGAILHATVRLPAELGPEFAKTIQRWGDRWANRVEKRLSSFFPKEMGETVIAYIWAHTVPCPTTGRPTPLAPDYWLARPKEGERVAVRLLPDAATGQIRTEIVTGPDTTAVGDAGTFKGGVGTSVWTGETFNTSYIRDQAADGHMGQSLLAVSVTRSSVRGRRFRSPSTADERAIGLAEIELERNKPRWQVGGLWPNEQRFIGPADRSARYGLRRMDQLFAPRQLLTAVTALEELRGVVAEARGELDEERTMALNLYLAFALDKVVDYSGILSSWHASRLTIRNTFDRHDFSFKWSFAEFDGASAAIPWGVSQVVDAYKGIANLARHESPLFDDDRRARVELTLGSATTLPHASGSIDAVITDPPYYDNVMYAECSDYFYVWLKRSLRDTWPELCQLVLTDKIAEAVANESLFRQVAGPKTRGRRVAGVRTASDLADERYEDLLTASFREANRVLTAEGVLTVMFTHKRVDAWDTLGQALLEAGFTINSSWPVHTESEHSLHQAKKNAANSTILLTCAKRTTTSPAYWSDIRAEVTRTARNTAARLSGDGMTGIDLTLATFGPVLSVLSRNWPVLTGELDDAGDPIVLRPDVALDLAREEVSKLKKRGLLGGRDVEFDRITDWYLLAWADFGAAEFPTGEALKLSVATHLELDDLSKRHTLIRATSGTVTLLSPAQRRTAGGLDPDAVSWPTLIDALHALLLTYSEDGAGAARSLLTRTGLGDDDRFHALVIAALHAIPRTREKGTFVRPEAAALEGVRTTLYDDIEAPADDEFVEATEQTLFDPGR